MFAANGVDIASQEELEEAIVVEYDDYTLAYRSEAERKHVEYYEGLFE